MKLRIKCIFGHKWKPIGTAGNVKTCTRCPRTEQLVEMQPTKRGELKEVWEVLVK